MSAGYHQRSLFGRAAANAPSKKVVLDEGTEDSDSLSDLDQEIFVPGPKQSSKAPSSSSRNLFAELDPQSNITSRPDSTAPFNNKVLGDEDDDLEDDHPAHPLDEDVGGLDEDAAVAKEEAIRQRIVHSQDQMRYILELFDEEQLRRYETFRRVGFSRAAIKKLMTKVLGQQVNTNSVIVVAGVAKVFVGELIEEARKVMDELAEPSGPITPFHIIEAHRRLKAVNMVPSSSFFHRSNRLLR